jgi:hypothetical protein
MYAHTPPAPPPKPPGTHDVSRMSTPASGQAPRPPPLPEAIAAGLLHVDPHSGMEYNAAQSQEVADPGDQWLPKFLQDKSYALRTLLLRLLFSLSDMRPHCRRPSAASKTWPTSSLTRRCSRP